MMRRAGEKPLLCVLQSGAKGSAKADGVQTALRHGVVKMNVDADTQWAYWDGVRSFYAANEDRLQGQVGNGDGPSRPNQAYYDPRAWLREAEVSMARRVEESCAALQNVN